MTHIIQKQQFDTFMPNTTKEVWNIIESDRAIEKDLTRKVINTRALARHILKKYALKASLDAVISAVRRFEAKSGWSETEKKIANLFKDAIIITRNNIVCLTTIQNDENDIIRLLKSISSDHIRIARGSKNTKIVFDQSLLKSVMAEIARKNILKIEEDLSELSITIDEKAIKTKGVLARIANEISLADINIEEVIICPPEFLIYVRQQNLVKTYESIMKL